MAIRRGIVPAAKLTPAPNGLFTVADVRRHGGADEHWIKGFSQESEACAFDASIIDVCGAVEDINLYDANDTERWADVAPFGIVARDHCLAPGWNAVDRKARVLRQLELITPKAVETELWNGIYRSQLDADEFNTTMFLASSEATVVEEGAQKPKVGLALLEQALAQCSTGFQGTIHMSPLIASMIGVEMQQDGDRLLTANGNPIAVGAGYDGRGPGETGPANNFTHWMYATGPVFVNLGSDELITVSEDQMLDPRTNEMTTVAERPASVHWDGCCHLAVQVDVRL